MSGFILVAFTALTGTAFAKDIYVSPTGTGTGSTTAPYGSIQSAVNAAVAGDNILLRAGTYKVCPVRLNEHTCH